MLLPGARTPSETWTSEFKVDPSDLTSTGYNPYFILEPDCALVLVGGDIELTITVLNETKVVDGVETRASLNARFFNEVASGVAMDRVTILSTRETVETPARTFTDCVQFLETTPLLPGVVDYKQYAADVGILQDGSLKLVQMVDSGEAEG